MATEEIYLSYARVVMMMMMAMIMAMVVILVLELKLKLKLEEMMTRHTVHGRAELPAANVQ